METIWLVVAGLLGLVVVSFVVYLIVSTARSRPTSGGRHRAPSRNRPHRDTFRTEEPEPEPKKRAAVIVQEGGEALRAEIGSQSLAADWDEPLWLPAEDVATAAAAARAALEAGVDVVCVCGDSAIARGVVSVLAGTETPLAFLPATPTATDPDAGGTWPEGDPVSDLALARAMTTALTGQNARVHVGRVVLAAAATAVRGVERPATSVRGVEGSASERSPEKTQSALTSTDQTPPAPTPQTLTSPALTSPAQIPPEQPLTETVFLRSLVIGDIVPIDEPALTTRKVAQDLFQGTAFTATVKPDDEEEITRPARSVSFEIGADQPDTGTSVPQALDAYLYASHSFKGWTGVARAMMRKSSRPTPLLVPMRSIAFTVTLDKPADLTIDGLAVGSVPPGESTISLDRQALVVRR